MPHPTSSTTTVAILSADTLVEDILARLLECEGYNTRLLEAYPADLVDELLDGVDLLLLAPSLSPDVRGAFLSNMRSTPKTAAIPVLSLSPTLSLALLDELAASAPWQSLFEELLDEIETALRSAANAGETPTET